MVAILMTQVGPPGAASVYSDFWTTAYAASDD
jgi:hypothetical protein